MFVGVQANLIITYRYKQLARKEETEIWIKNYVFLLYFIKFSEHKCWLYWLNKEEWTKKRNQNTDGKEDGRQSEQKIALEKVEIKQISTYAVKMDASSATQVIKTRLNMLLIYGYYKHDMSILRPYPLWEWYNWAHDAMPEVENDNNSKRSYKSGEY